MVIDSLIIHQHHTAGGAAEAFSPAAPLLSGRRRRKLPSRKIFLSLLYFFISVRYNGIRWFFHEYRQFRKAVENV